MHKISNKLYFLFNLQIVINGEEMLSFLEVVNKISVLEFSYKDISKG